MIFDFHTHREPQIPYKALVNCSPEVLATKSLEGYYSVGIHPWNVQQAVGSEEYWQNFSSLLSRPEVLAVGEAGIDRSSGVLLDVQEAFFVQQIRVSEELGKPLIIHAVHADDRMLYLRKKMKPSQPWAVHGFRAKPVAMKSYLEAGFYISFGERCNEESLRQIPADRLFLETDESMLPIEEIYERAAKVRNVSSKELEGQLAANLYRFFGRVL
ncbi:MAG: TatD family deoxyribonuclease [Mediterranea massiliensis]|nr:TatD family deoxyribonuclease [Mediterranea massiliensis]